MSRQKTYEEAEKLALAMQARAEWGRNVILSPPTAIWLATTILNACRRHEIPKPKSKLDVNLHSEGSTIYRLDERGEIEEVVAWARNSLVAAEAFDALKERYPKDRFVQRRRAWVERE